MLVSAVVCDGGAAGGARAFFDVSDRAGYPQLRTSNSEIFTEEHEMLWWNICDIFCDISVIIFYMLYPCSRVNCEQCS